GMEEKLRRLCHRTDEQKQTYCGERIDVPTEEMKGFAGERRRLRENGVEIHRAGEIEHGENAERKAEVADAIDQKGFDGGSIGFWLVIPEADQQITCQPDAFPAEK